MVSLTCRGRRVFTRPLQTGRMRWGTDIAIVLPADTDGRAGYATQEKVLFAGRRYRFAMPPGLRPLVSRDTRAFPGRCGAVEERIICGQEERIVSGQEEARHFSDPSAKAGT